MTSEELVVIAIEAQNTADVVITAKSQYGSINITASIDGKFVTVTNSDDEDLIGVNIWRDADADNREVPTNVFIDSFKDANWVLK